MIIIVVTDKAPLFWKKFCFLGYFEWLCIQSIIDIEVNHILLNLINRYHY